MQEISENTKCVFETDDKEFIVSSSFKVQKQNENFGLKWSSCFLYCSFATKQQTKFKNVYLVHKDTKLENIPKNSALRVHYPKLDAKEANQTMQKMAVCVKPLHYHYNRGLWVSKFFIKFHTTLHNIGSDFTKTHSHFHFSFRQ